jgi:hypothetical protein
VCISKARNDFNKRWDSSNPNPFGTEEALFFVFMEMKAMVEEMYEDRKKAKGTSGKGKGKPHNFEK